MSDEIDDLIDSARPRTEEVRVCARGDLVVAHQRAAIEWDRWLTAEGDDALAVGSEARAAHQAMADIEAQIDDAAVTIVMATIPAYKWTNLLGRHHPTREQREQGMDHNVDTFPQVAVAACSQGRLSPERAEKLRNTLHSAEWNKLWGAALFLNNQEMPSPKLAAATASLLASASSLTPSSLEGSLAQPSSDGSGAPQPRTTTGTEGD